MSARTFQMSWKVVWQLLPSFPSGLHIRRSVMRDRGFQSQCQELTWSTACAHLQTKINANFYQDEKTRPGCMMLWATWYNEWTQTILWFYGYVMHLVRSHKLTYFAFPSFLLKEKKSLSFLSWFLTPTDWELLSCGEYCKDLPALFFLPCSWGDFQEGSLD